MNGLDVIIIIVVIIGIVRGLRSGLLIQGLSLVGFFVGLFAGSLLAPWVTNFGHDTFVRFLLTLGITFGLGIIVSGIGEAIGNSLHFAAVNLSLGSLDRILGGVFEIAAVLAAAWLIAAPLGNLQAYNIGREVKGSAILRVLNNTLPPAPTIVARLEHFIEPNGFPKVFLGQEPTPTPQALPSQSQIAAAASRDQASVVKIEGLGCGGLVEGSGFVVSAGLVATNAHVVAGIRQPEILDARGIHRATTIFFDPDLDFAVLSATDLAGPPVLLDSATAADGTAEAVLGYPGGGPFAAVVASVLDETRAVGRNIYGSGATARDIYEINADVQPGNSGGPLISTTGQVMGVVFAKSETTNNLGYALTTAEIIPEIQQAESSRTAVGTGVCTSS